MGDISKNTESAVKNIQSDSKQVSAISGDDKKRIVASSSNHTYFIRPCSLSEMPKLSDLLETLQKSLVEGQKSGKTEYQLMMDKNSGLLDTMAEIILLGIKKDSPDMTKETVMDEFSLGDFPKVYQEVLDLNDFLSGMRTVLQMI